jgi:hypothetical protein
MKEIEIKSNADLISAVKNDIGPFDEKQLENILEVFPYKNWEVLSSDIVINLSRNGNTNPGEIVRNAACVGILSVSSVENDGSVYFDLGFNGEVLWDEMNNKRKQEIWNTTYML